MGSVMSNILSFELGDRDNNYLVKAAIYEEIPGRKCPMSWHLEGNSCVQYSKPKLYCPNRMELQGDGKCRLNSKPQILCKDEKFKKYVEFGNLHGCVGTDYPEILCPEDQLFYSYHTVIDSGMSGTCRSIEELGYMVQEMNQQKGTLLNTPKVKVCPFDTVYNHDLKTCTKVIKKDPSFICPVDMSWYPEAGKATILNFQKTGDVNKYTVSYGCVLKTKSPSSFTCPSGYATYIDKCYELVSYDSGRFIERDGVKSFYRNVTNAMPVCKAGHILSVHEEHTCEDLSYSDVNVECPADNYFNIREGTCEETVYIEPIEMCNPLWGKSHEVAGSCVYKNKTQNNSQKELNYSCEHLEHTKHLKWTVNHHACQGFLTDYVAIEVKSNDIYSETVPIYRCTEGTLDHMNRCKVTKPVDYCQKYNDNIKDPSETLDLVDVEGFQVCLNIIKI